MATTQYIGSRYVPVLADPVEWSSAKSYEPLTIVTHEGNSYTSRQFVPVGVDISDDNYWALTGNYNAQVEQYRRETAQTVATNKVYTDNAVSQVEEWLADAQGKYGAKPFAFDTVADMQANYKVLYEGAICHTNGFHASGDGGAAWYVIGASGTANGMDVLACGNLFANLIVMDPFVTPEMFGAFGNGTSNDTSTLQRAIDFAYDKHIKVMLTRKYYITDTINLYGVNATDVKFGSCLYGQVDAELITDEDINIIELKAKEDNLRAYGIKINNLILNGSRQAINGIYCNVACSECNFENITIKYCNNGIHMNNNCYLNTFNSVRTYHVTEYGILFTNGNNTSNVFTKCYVDAAKTAYKINGQYSSLISCCADVITENVYELSSFNGALIGCGSEAGESKCMFKIGASSNVAIIGGFYYALNAQDVYYFDIAAGSNVIMSGAMINYTTLENTPNALYTVAYLGKLTLRNVTIYRQYVNNSYQNPNAIVVINNGVTTTTKQVTLNEHNEATLDNINSSDFAILDISTSRSGWTLILNKTSSNTYKVKVCSQTDYNPTITDKNFTFTITLLAKNSV